MKDSLFFKILATRLIIYLETILKNEKYIFLVKLFLFLKKNKLIIKFNKNFIKI
jgi:hypothetical protein